MPVLIRYQHGYVLALTILRNFLKCNRRQEAFGLMRGGLKVGADNPIIIALVMKAVDVEEIPGHR